MNTSTHRMIQLSQLADSCFALASESRRAASSAASAGMRPAAMMFTRQGQKAYYVYFAAMARMRRAGASLEGTPVKAYVAGGAA